MKDQGQKVRMYICKYIFLENYNKIDESEDDISFAEELKYRIIVKMEDLTDFSKAEKSINNNRIQFSTLSQFYCVINQPVQ